MTLLWVLRRQLLKNPLIEDCIYHPSIVCKFYREDKVPKTLRIFLPVYE